MTLASALSNNIQLLGYSYESSDIWNLLIIKINAKAKLVVIRGPPFLLTYLNEHLPTSKVY